MRAIHVNDDAPDMALTTEQLTYWAGSPTKVDDTFAFDVTTVPGMDAQLERDDVMDELLRDDVYRLSTFTSEGDVWVDAGCHIGIFAIAAMQHGADVSVMIDMDPTMAWIGQLNARAFSAQRAARQLDDRQSFRDRVRPSGVTVRLEDGAELVDLAMLTKDAWAGKRACLKLDVQGSEGTILARHARELSEAYDRLVMEWHMPLELAAYAVHMETNGWRIDAIKSHRDVLLNTDTQIVWATSLDA